MGGTHYGRYSKISDEETWNLIVSDGWAVPYAGYANVLTLASGSVGRGLYASYRANIMTAVIGSAFYVITANATTGILSASGVVGTLATNTGDVYMAENNGGQIVITDGVHVYVYNYNTFAFVTLSSTDFPFPSPGYVSFQNGHIIIASGGTTNWVLSAENDATMWSNTAQFVGSLQSKPDFIQAAVPMPGGGNNILIFGRNVAELWQDVGAALFPYQRASTFNVDYGCINPASIASLKNYVVWIAVNEQSGPVLMVATGNSIEPISTDGIDFKLGNLTDPTNCTGFLYQQDGHLLYQFTFPTDNLTYAFDFETKLFFCVSDENLNYHIARQIVYYNDTYYFVSLNGGNIYEFDTLYSDADYGAGNVFTIPRIRITPPLRLPTQRPFIVKSAGFTIENGLENTITNNIIYSDVNEILDTESGLNILCENGDILCTEQDVSETPIAYTNTSSSAVFLSTSRDGAVTFGSEWRLDMNPTAYRKSRFLWQRLGRANDITFQFRFEGLTRFTFTNGTIELYE